jgi:hypothetical protein
MSHSDVWKLGKDSVDLRIKASAFSRVQRFFPNCNVVVSNLEAHVQEAEALMFPMRKADEEAWMAAVAQEAFPKVCTCKVKLNFYYVSQKRNQNHHN